MTQKEQLVQDGYDTLMGTRLGNIRDFLDDHVVLVDCDLNNLQIDQGNGGKEAVVAYLQSLRKVVLGTPRFKEVGGNVICVDHMVRGDDNHACVDRFEFSGAGPNFKISRIEICYVKGPDILCPCPPKTAGPGIENPVGAPVA